MSDTHTVVTRQSWGSRLKGSFKGIMIGFVLVALAALLLFKNEGRSVRRYKALAEGAREVVSINADQLSAANESKLVHLSGPANTDEILRDADFGIAVQAIHLDRSVEMYQWRESSDSKTEKKVGGSTETTTTYSYRRVWSDRPIDSSYFQKEAGHENPPMPYQARRVSATRVTLGAFQLGSGLIDRIRGATELPVRSTTNLPLSLRVRARLHGNGLYIGRDPAAPRVGDLRVSFTYVAPQVVSVVARQTGSTLGPHTTRSGGTVQLLRAGNVGAEEMFTAAREANKTLTWILRVVGFLIMWFGFRTILAPFGVMADVLPAFGNLVSKGTRLVAAAVALPLSLLIIAVAWIWYRPILAISILALAAIAVVGFVKLIRKRAAAPPPAPAVPPRSDDLPPLPTGDA